MSGVRIALSADLMQGRDGAKIAGWNIWKRFITSYAGTPARDVRRSQSPACRFLPLGRKVERFLRLPTKKPPEIFIAGRIQPLRRPRVKLVGAVSSL